MTTEEDDSRWVTAMPALTHVTGETFNSRVVENGQGRMEGVLDLDEGGRLPIEIRLVKENDNWKILAYHVTGAGEKKAE